MNVIYFDVVKKLPLGNSNAVDSLEELLKQSDFVSLHVPATEETKNLIGQTELDCMQAGSYLINASRGSVVDILALKASLQSGKRMPKWNKRSRTGINLGLS